MLKYITNIYYKCLLKRVIDKYNENIGTSFSTANQEINDLETIIEVNLMKLSNKVL